jgi:hypothetical protein
MACRGSAVRIRLAPLIEPLSWRGFLVPDRQAAWDPRKSLGAFLGALFVGTARSRWAHSGRSLIETARSTSTDSERQVARTITAPNREVAPRGPMRLNKGKPTNDRKRRLQGQRGASNVQLNFRIRQQLADRLRQRAEELNSNTGTLVAQAIEQLLTQNEQGRQGDHEQRLLELERRLHALENQLHPKEGGLISTKDSY